MRVTSPCIGICQMDDASGYCIGCGRTIEEISGWSGATDQQRQATIAQLPERPVPTPTPTPTPSAATPPLKPHSAAR
ncbi:MAG: DUF1289 domain-containing protein [Rhodocyclaceae bacterium]|nr:DUF1289 domain-containing protein [Rhodocyclaceae bacterium]MBK6908605.1 DUF1289 domain-containing protein [Rhodocyclaceae bacterium]